MSASFEFSTDVSRFDIDFIHSELSTTYWAKSIPRETLEKSMANSMCFGIFKTDGTQIGFARVVSDRATFAYLCDVIITASERGHGLGKQFMQYIFNHPDLQGLRRFTLATRDAHGLYAQFGFKQPADPTRLMEIAHPNMYERMLNGEKF